MKRRVAEPRSGRGLQAAIDALDRASAVTCDHGPPPRSVPHAHGQRKLIDRLVRETAVAADKAQHAALRSHVLLQGGHDIDADPDENWEPFIWSSSRLREEQTDAAQLEIRSHAESLGLPLIAVGAFRTVYGLSRDEVLKVSIRPEEDEQTRREVNTWKWSSEDEASWLCPVHAAGSVWLVMARVEPYRRPTPDGRVLADFRRFSRDVNEDNVGILCGRTVLVDYGD